jgi:hypothetical protein
MLLEQPPDHLAADEPGGARDDNPLARPRHH